MNGKAKQNSMKRKEILDNTNGLQKPSMASISSYVQTPLFEQLRNHVEVEYQSKPVLEYSRCSCNVLPSAEVKKRSNRNNMSCLYLYDNDGINQENLSSILLIDESILQLHIMAKKAKNADCNGQAVTKMPDHYIVI